MQCKNLTGRDETPTTIRQARALLGKRVAYLRSCDIDRSGRGYFFPRYGTVTDAARQQIEIGGDWMDLRSIVELTTAPQGGRPC